MSDDKTLRELEAIKREVAELKANMGRKKVFSKIGFVFGIALIFIITSFVSAETISKPYTFTSGTTISAAEVNADFDSLYSESNSQHTRIAALEANSHGKANIRYIICISGVWPAIEGGDNSDIAMIGEIRMFAGMYAPGGWMNCEGQILPIVQNQVLYAVLGTQFGGDGKNNFALPDLRGKSPVHPIN